MRTSMYPVTAVLVVAAVFGTDIGAQPRPCELRQQMVGTWTLSEQWVEQDGKKIQRFGANPKGIAIYDSNGRFATILLRADLPQVRVEQRDDRNRRGEQGDRAGE